MSATWPQVESVLAVIGSRVSDQAWQLNVPIGDTGRAQKVFAFYETSIQDLELIKLQSSLTLMTRSDSVAAGLPMSATAEADLLPLLREVGQLLIGGLGFVPNDQDSGFIVLANTFPLGLLDLSNPSALLVYIARFAGAADRMERKYADQYGKTSTQDVF